MRRAPPGVDQAEWARAQEKQRTDVGTVEEAMSDGPRTIRPDVRLDKFVGWMHRRSLTTAVVTTSDGRLVGVVRLAEAEARLAAEEPDSA